MQRVRAFPSEEPVPRWEGRALRPQRLPSPQGAAALEAEGRALGQGQPGGAQRSPARPPLLQPVVQSGYE